MNNEQVLNEDMPAETIIKGKITKSRSHKTKDEFKEKECEVINHNKYTKTLDIRFDGYGVRIKNIDSFNNNNGFTIIKYKGEIGKSDFMVKI